MKPGLVSLPFTRIIVFLFMLMTWPTDKGLSQHYQTTTYTESDGLANSMVFDIVQDSSGVIWIGRRLGISSYDGTAFTNYTVADGLRSASYSLLTLDEMQVLWAIPESGAPFFSRYDGTKWQTVLSSGQLPADFMATYSSVDVYYDKGGPVLLIGTMEHQFLEYKEKQWRIYSTADGFPGNIVYSIRWFEGAVYIASDKGLTVFRNGKMKPVQIAGTQLPSGSILAMERKDKRLWLLGESWLGYLSEGNFTLVTSKFRLPVNGLGRHCFLHAGRNGRIYFGNSFKVFLFYQYSKSLGKLDRNNGMITEGGSSVLVDREMNTWIAGFRGITKIPSERFSSLSQKDGLCSNEVASAIEISPGKYVFGHDGCLTFYNGKAMAPFMLDRGRGEGNYETRVIDIQKDLHGALWISASSLGLAHMDKNRRLTWYHENEGLLGSAYTVAITQSGDLYAGTTKGLFQFNQGRFKPVNLGIINNRTIRKIFPGKNDTIYLATLNSGLIRIKGSEFTTCASADNPLANNVYSFFTDSRNRQFVGTAVGLYEIAGQELKRVNRHGLMINRPVYLILEDHDRNLWFGTDNGVYRWNGTNLHHFTVADGLSGQDINRAAGFVDSQHHVWFGTNNGITVFRPELDYKPGQVPAPKVRLLPVIAGNDSIEASVGKSLPYDMDDLTFHARTISLINERQIFVKYYLEGSDTGWSDELPYSGGHYTYNNLNPGDYRFFFKSRNSIGIWSDPVVSATFTIESPFWLRYWFMCLEILLFSGVVFITTRFILTNHYKNQLKKEVSLRTRELRLSEMQLQESNAAKNTFFSIIAHDLRNPFNSILGFLEILNSDDKDFTQEEKKRMLLQTQSVSLRTFNLLENLLTWAQSQRGSLPFEPATFHLGEIIAENLHLVESTAKKKTISIIDEGKGDFSVFADKNMISTVVRNLVSNALKFTFPGGTIIVGMELQDEKTVLVYVKDNGMGMSPDILGNLFKIEERTVIKGTANETGTGFGLILCKEFIVKNGGEIRVISAKGEGSTFSFTLPYVA
ncbi:MAG: ATP-binding protein [Bacteroidota bacterium]